jgi:hypothetical protein
MEHAHTLSGRYYGERTVFGVELLDDAPPHLRRRLVKDPRGHRWVHPEDIPMPVFVETGAHRDYDAATQAPEIFVDAMRLDPDDPEELLAFVGKWGLLGLHGGGVEPVAEVRDELRRLQRLARWCEALHARRWKSPQLPAPPSGFAKVPARKRLQRRWRLYAFAFDDETRRLDVTVRPILASDRRGRVRPELRPARLIEILYFELWRVSVDPATTLRVCEDCKALFPVRKSNALKKFCSWRCKNRANVRNWYRRERGSPG